MICYGKFDTEDRYYCRAGYSCCGVRSCCATGHSGLYQTNWFWVVWALIIFIVCCCSYAKQRRRNGRMMPFVFYSPRNRAGNESEEELLAGPTEGVFFIPPEGGDQTVWSQADWYKANKPPPYSLVAPLQSSPPTEQASRLQQTPSAQPQVPGPSTHANPPIVTPSPQPRPSNPHLPPGVRAPNAAVLQVNAPSEPPPEYSEL